MSLIEVKRGYISVAVVFLLTIAGVALAADEAMEVPDGTRADGYSSPESYWEQARSEVFMNIELTEAQEEGVDSILAEAESGRKRYASLQARLNEARKEGNQELSAELSKTVIEIRETFRPTARIMRMGELLNDEQRIVFDRNLRLRGDREAAQQLARDKAARLKASNPEAAENALPSE